MGCIRLLRLAAEGDDERVLPVLEVEPFREPEEKPASEELRRCTAALNEGSELTRWKRVLAVGASCAIFSLSQLYYETLVATRLCHRHVRQMRFNGRGVCVVSLEFSPWLSAEFVASRTGFPAKRVVQEGEIEREGRRESECRPAKC